MMTPIILKNIIQCSTCQTILESVEMHDMVSCPCPEETRVSAYGGRYYLQRFGTGWTELSETRDISHLTDIIKDINSHNGNGYEVLQCEKGWWELVTQCHTELKRIDPKYRIIQIKQKFGGLRYYFTTELGPETVELMHEIVRRYEKRLDTVCELTGLEGQQYKTSTGWYTIRNPQYAPKDAKPVQLTE